MRKRPLLPALLALLLLGAYLPALKHGATNWDDPEYTVNNPALKGPAAAFASSRLGHYHPLSDISLALETRLFGEVPAAHHAGNLLLHAANAALLFFFLAALLGSDAAAFAGAAVWALHPVNAESAAWIAERKNLLCAFFYLGALLAYLRPPSRRRTAAVFVLFLAAILSKASAVTLPLVLLALDWLKGRPMDRGNLLEKGGLLAVAAAFALLAAAAQGRQGQLLPGGFGLFSFYLLKSVWPLGLSALYPYRETLAALRASPFLYGLPAAVFAALLARAVRKGRQLEAFGLLFFLINILPFALLIPIGPALAADRYLYLPLMGLVLAAAAALGTLRIEGRAARAAAGGLAAALFAALLGLTLSRVAIWRSSETLWTSVLKTYPASSTANLNLAEVLLERGDAAGALPLLRASLATDPENPGALYDLGTLLARAGRPAEALPLLRRAVQLKPDSAPAWNNLGLTELALGRPAEARKAFLTAAAADPDYAPAGANLAAADKARPRAAR